MQIIERAITLDFDSSNVLSDTLNASRDDGQIRTLVRLIHDGIPVTLGFVLTQYKQDQVLPYSVHMIGLPM